MVMRVGKKTADIRGILFDMDGTILDSMENWYHLADEFLERYGCIHDEDITNSFITDTTPDIVKNICRKYHLGICAKQMEKEINAMIEEVYFSKAGLKTGVREYFEYLVNNHVKIAIVTASERYLVEAMCTRTGIKDYVDCIVTCTEAGEGKYTSKVYDMAAQYLGVEKENSIIFEDALYAIRTAKDAGYLVVGVEEKVMQHDRNEICQLTDMYIKTMTEMIHI